MDTGIPGEPAVYLIDDDEAVRTSLAFVLECSDHVVRVFASAAAFLEASPRLSRGCVISDIRMPDMNGLEMIRALREAACDLPVIAMTGHADDLIREEARRAGANAFLEKPFSEEQLLAAVDAVMRK